MTTPTPFFRKVDAVTVPVPGLDEGLRFYSERLGHAVLWRNDATGQAGLALPDSDTELVLTTSETFEPDWLVESVDSAIHEFERAGGSLLVAPQDIPVGRLAVVLDPFGNTLVLVDLSKGVYTTDASGRVTGVRARPDEAGDASA
jgi:predicted enzyme related to lactoylglutathione lyase